MTRDIAGALRITLLGLNYAPEPTGIAPYTSGLAVGLNDRGHDVRVVTTFPHYPQWKIQPGYDGFSRSDQVSGVPVHRVRHYVPRMPNGPARAVSEVSFGARLVVANWGAPDVVICISPALVSSAMAVARSSWGRRRPALGLVLQDLYSDGLIEAGVGGRAIQRAFAGVEGWSARRVDGVAVIHDRFKARVAGHLAVPQSQIAVLRNWTHVRPEGNFDRERTRHELGWIDKNVVLHAGAMGVKQGLLNVVEAARHAEAQGIALHFVLMGDGSQRASLEAAARGVSTIDIMRPLDDARYGRALRAADALLVNEKPGILEMAVPSKLTSYFSAGVPVLAATHPSSITADEVRDSGAGVQVIPGDPLLLVGAAQALCADHAARAVMGARGPEYCAKVLSRELAIDGYETWIQHLVGRAAARQGEP